MPITAKLSRQFYDRFGDDIVNELVGWLNQVDLAFRSELMRVGDAYLDRSNARLEQRLAELSAALRIELRADFARVEKELRAAIARVEKELRAEIARVEKELRAEIGRVEIALRKQIADLKADLLTWMFVFWATTLIAILFR